MIKKTLNLCFLLFLLFISGCGYKPILIGSDYDFSIKVENSIGNKDINTKIENKIKILNGVKRTFKLDFASKETKNILSKDSKGDPSKFEISITTSYQVMNLEKTLINRKINKKNNYNNESDKFKLEQSEKIIVQNDLTDFDNAKLLSTKSKKGVSL